jgi:hypothetical protein
MTSRTSRISMGVALAVGCAAMFVVPSACVIDRGGPRWLALAVGALAFPLVPAVWHLIAERLRRRRVAASQAAKGAKPAKPGLTAWDRLLLRALVVAVVALGGTWAIARGDTWHALRHHALWFTDWSEPDPIGDSELLARVPAAAEAIVWIRAGHTKDLLPVALSGDVELVLAFGGDEQLIVARGSDEVLDQLLALSALGKDGGKLLRVDAPAGMRILATPGWRARGEARPLGLLEMLRQAPGDANAMVVAKPTTMKSFRGISTFVGWARVGDRDVEFGAEVEAVDAKAADQVAARVGKLPASEDCGNRAFRDATDTSLVRDGLRFKGAAKLSLDAARGIPQCMASRGFGAMP